MEIRVLSPSQAGDFLFIKTPKLAVDPSSFLFSGYRSICVGGKAAGTNFDHLLPSILSLRVIGAMPFSPLHASLSRTRTVLLITDSNELGRKFIKHLNYAYLVQRCK